MLRAGVFTSATLLVLLAACSSDPADDAAASTASSGPPVSAGPVAAAELAPGDCVTGLVIGVDERSAIESASVVRCDQPHELEVFSVFDLTPGDFDNADGAYPGQQRVVDRAETGCGSQLEELGEVADSIGLIAVWPTAESWASGDRSVACAAYSITGNPIGDGFIDD